MKDQPLIPASTKLPEITFKAVIISIILAAVLSAANAYLALKIGTTISASIPASVLAIGILSFFKRSNVLESNIIQTAASAGEGVAAALAFILPAMIILKIWKGFPYWETTSLSLIGGLLGVLFSIPLRRVLLDMPTLRFPEGTAIGNVLKSSTKKGNQLKFLAQGAGVGGLFSFLQSGFKLVSDHLSFWAYAGRGLFGINFGLTSASLAAGYIIGPEVGMSLLAGIVIGWLVILPILSHTIVFSHHLSPYNAAMYLWSKHLRFIGVGTMLLGGIWTLIKLTKPVLEGLKISFATLKKTSEGVKKKIIRTERDIPANWMLIGVGVFATLFFWLFLHELLNSGLHYSHAFYWMVAGITIVYVLIVGFLLSTICGYFVGLVGSTNNPLSGILIIGILILSLAYLALFHLQQAGEMIEVVSFVILVAAVVATVAAIANENLQDLKAGRMVGATPWKQQVMLAVGVISSTLIIGPVLNLLFKAYGMGGVFPHPGMDPSQMLGAPQASLMAAVSKGVLTQNLQWNMIFIGMAVAVLVIIADEFLKRHNRRLPALAVGLSIYLPPEVMTPIVLGSVINWLVKRHRVKNKINVADGHAGNGVLLACGIVAGSALMGVILAIPFVLMGSSDALAIVPKSFAPFASILGIIGIAMLCWWLYRTASASDRSQNRER